MPLQFVWRCECPFTPFLRTLKSIKKALIRWWNPTGRPFIMMCNMAWTLILQVKSYEAVADLGEDWTPLTLCICSTWRGPQGGEKLETALSLITWSWWVQPPLHLSPPREVTWANICWVCAAGLSEPLPHYSLFCGHIIDPILVTLGKK